MTQNPESIAQSIAQNLADAGIFLPGHALRDAVDQAFTKFTPSVADQIGTAEDALFAAQLIASQGGDVLAGKIERAAADTAPAERAPYDYACRILWEMHTARYASSEPIPPLVADRTLMGVLAQIHDIAATTGRRAA